MYRVLLVFALFIGLSSCNGKLDELEQRVSDLESKVSLMENKLAEMDEILTKLSEAGKLTEQEFIEIQKTIDELETRLSSGTDNIDNLESDISNLYETLTELMNTDVYQSLTGKVEKGGFLQGSLLYLYELTPELAQTGRNFNAVINDNFGSFGLDVQNLKGKICRVITDGFYYNEVFNSNSDSKISLTGLIKIDSGEVINVNILTHLERPRVEFLIKQGLDFDSAKTKAISEVLSVFGIENPGIKRAEKVGLIGVNDQNKILLALSTTLLGFRSDSELTEILSEIASDLKEDGVLNTSTPGDNMKTHLYYMDTTKILNQIRDKYSSQYEKTLLDELDFKYIGVFENTTNFKNLKNLISYPLKGTNNLENILNPTYTKVTSFEQFEINLNTHAGIDVTIQFIRSDGKNFNILSVMGTTSWLIEQVNGVNTGIFKTSDAGVHNLGLLLESKGEYQLIYYEKGGTIETDRRTFVVE